MKNTEERQRQNRSFLLIFITHLEYPTGKKDKACICFFKHIKRVKGFVHIWKQMMLSIIREHCELVYVQYKMHCVTTQHSCTFSFPADFRRTTVLNIMERQSNQTAVLPKCQLINAPEHLNLQHDSCYNWWSAKKKNPPWSVTKRM